MSGRMDDFDLVVRNADIVTASERFHSNRLTGSYAAVATALGAHAERRGTQVHGGEMP